MNIEQLATLNDRRRIQCSRAIEHMLTCARQASAAYGEGDATDRVRAFVLETKRWSDFVLEDLVEDDVRGAAANYAGGKQRTA